MSMKEKYNALFEKISPRMSDEELLSAVIDRKAVNMSNFNKKKLFGKNAIIIPAAAAAVLLCTTVGVSAAVNWDLLSAIRSLFNKPESTNGFTFKDYDLDSIGSEELAERYERDGYTIQMLGVAADKHTSFLLYDIILDEGYTFKNDLGEYTYSNGDEAFVTIWSTYESYDMLVSEYVEDHLRSDDVNDFDITKFSENESPDILGQEGNVIHCAQRYDVKPLSLKDKEITFDIRGIHLESSDGIRCFEEADGIPDKLTIKYDFINESSELSLENSVAFSFGEKMYSINSAELTPLSLYLRVEWGKGRINADGNEDGVKDYMVDYDDVRETVKVRFKDGSVTDSGMLCWNKYDGGNLSETNGSIYSDYHFMWKYPVDIYDIDAIIIGDGEFKIG